MSPAMVAMGPAHHQHASSKMEDEVGLKLLLIIVMLGHAQGGRGGWDYDRRMLGAVDDERASRASEGK